MNPPGCGLRAWVWAADFKGGAECRKKRFIMGGSDRVTTNDAAKS